MMSGDNTMQNISYRVALGGIVSSFCLLSMFLTGVIPAFSLVLPMVSGLLLLIMILEVNIRWAALTYAAVGLLSLFVTYDKEAALIFIMFFGLYPLLQTFLNRIKPLILRIAVKLLVFNVIIAAYFQLNVMLFGLEEMMAGLEDMGGISAGTLLLILNPFFLMYDYALYNAGEMYMHIIKPRIRGKNRREM